MAQSTDPNGIDSRSMSHEAQPKESSGWIPGCEGVSGTPGLDFTIGYQFQQGWRPFAMAIP